MSLPFSFRVGDLNAQFFDDDGVPLAGGFIHTLEAGTSNDKDTYADADTVSPTVNQNPVPLDSAGRCVMFLEAGAYDFEVMDSTNVVLRTVEGVEDIGLTFLSTLGQQLAEGSRDVIGGYTVLSTDNTITVDSTGGPNPCIINLPPVADRGQDITIINLGTVPLSITPNGAETINDVAAAYTVAASSSPSLSTITLRPDVSSNWFVLTSATSGGGGGGGTGTVTHVPGALTANQLVIGNGGDDIQVLGSLGTTTTVLHGNAGGAPSYGAIVTNDITDNAVTNAKLATMATGTVKANITGGSAVPTDVTYADLATAMGTISVPFAADTVIDFGKAFFDLKILTSAPAAPAAGYMRIYAIDNGGKVEFAVRFPSGAAQQVEIEP